MTEPDDDPRARRRDRRAAERRRRRRAALRWAVRVVALAAAFWIGLAAGRALEEAPRPGGTQTLVRTLEPDTLPAVTRTVTVTTSVP